MNNIKKGQINERETNFTIEGKNCTQHKVCTYSSPLKMPIIFNQILTFFSLKLNYVQKYIIYYLATF